MIETIPAREILHCDQDPTHAKRPAETVHFGLDGRDYETELCAKDRTAFDKMIAPYLEIARKVGKVAVAKAPKTKRRTAAMRQHSANVRAWGIENGLIPDDETGRHGRLPVSVTRAYDAEHSAKI